MPRDILVIDDEADIRTALKGLLEDEGYAVRLAASVEQGFEQLVLAQPDLLLLDVWLKTGDRDGLDLLARVRKRWPDLPVLMMSGHGTIEMAVTAIKQGAYDFIEKPFQADRLLLTIERAIEANALRAENRILREQMEGAADLIGTSAQINGLRHAVEKVAPTNSRVMLTGAPGSGKEVVARMIHRMSTRAMKPFVAINCALLEPEKIESEMFGSSHHPGTLKQADGGTLFLDEVADMPAGTQAKILRLLQDQKYQHPVTGAWIDVDVRVLTSTSRDIPDLIQVGRFREDLYYRLNVVTLQVPALAERRDDIPAFISHFMAVCAQGAGKPVRSVSDSAMAALQLYAWPGNVRQIKNVAEWLVIMAPGAVDQPIGVDDLPPEVTGAASSADQALFSPDLMALPLREAREQFERHYLQAQISRFGGSVSKAAAFVGMERSALHRKIKSLNVNGDDSEQDAPENDNARAVA